MVPFSSTPTRLTMPGSSSYTYSEKGLQGHDWKSTVQEPPSFKGHIRLIAVLPSPYARLPHKQENLRWSSCHPIKTSSKQNRRIHHPFDATVPIPPISLNIIFKYQFLIAEFRRDLSAVSHSNSRKKNVRRRVLAQAAYESWQYNRSIYSWNLCHWPRQLGTRSSSR